MKEMYRSLEQMTHFRWLSGMSAYDEEADTEYLVVVREGVVYGISDKGVYGELPKGLSVLDTPATRGCLLALIREEHPSAFVEVRQRTGGFFFLVQFDGKAHYLDHRTQSEFDALCFTLDSLEDIRNLSTRNLYLLKIEIDALSRVVDDYGSNPDLVGDEWVQNRMNLLVEELTSMTQAYFAEARK